MPERLIRPSGAVVTLCKSWDEFIQELRPTPAKGYGQRIFRGHADPDWKLSSTWERKLNRFGYPSRSATYGSRTEYESHRDRPLNQFKHLARTMPDMPSIAPNEDNDWWALGRHYGLETPLLDWSRSPFIAAFWAFVERMEAERRHNGSSWTLDNLHLDKHLVVWELVYDRELERGSSERIEVFSKGEFDLIDNARYDLHRQRAQQGVFTRLEHDWNTDVEAYLSSKKIVGTLERYEIPCSSMKELSAPLSDLERMNIHYGTVYPDPQGAATQVNMEPDWRKFRNEGSFGAPSMGYVLPVDR